MMNIVNIAAYRFVALDDLPALQKRLLEVCNAEGLRGTILLAAEGINLVIAGTEQGVANFRGVLAGDDRLRGLDFKESRSSFSPFRRLKIRIKKEIIAFGEPGIDPARDPAPALDAQTLKAWLDEGRPVILLDTRNAFEMEHGSFVGAMHLGNTTFREFGVEARKLPAAGPDTPVVTFCTGGIRCEKAAPLLRQMGHRNVYQLAGGILRYLEAVGAAHYRGTCFVFDERISLDGDLAAQKNEQL